MNKELRGRNVAVLAADGFEYAELIVPMKALRLAGAKVDIVSLHRGKIRGMNLTAPTRTICVDKTLAQANPSDYDALLLPGGLFGPDFLRQSRLARDFVRELDALGRPIATLCHGPWLLVSAELVQGRHLSSWPGIRDDIVHAGGLWHDRPVVRDHNWVSSRGPQDLHHFVPAMLQLFRANAPAAISGGEPNETSSEKPERPLELAVATARFLPGPTARSIAAIALGAAAAIAIGRRLTS